MKKVNYIIPSLEEPTAIPKIQKGSAAHLKPLEAKPVLQRTLGYPGALEPEWKEKAVAKMGELVEGSRALRLFLDSCVKCGACTDKCHYFLGTSDAKNMPVGRQDLFRQVYRRYFTFSGKYLPWLVGAKDFSEEVLEDWWTYFHQCSQCRRCTVFCPLGIDTTEISIAAREIMTHVGRGQKYCNQIIGRAQKIGNNLGMPVEALRDTLQGLEEDVWESDHVAVRFPIDEKGADVLLITPSADFFAEPHVDGLIGYAKVLHQAGIAWTISSVASEAANFGLFVGNHDHMKKMAMRIREAALQLGVKRIVFGECGHAWRVACNFLETLAGPLDFLDQNYPIPQHICEVTHDLIHSKRIKLNPEANDDMVVTFHDSCNIARASTMGDIAQGQFIIPRAILRASCNHFFDMPDKSIKQKTYCCAAGGGLLTDELMELRVKGAAPRMRAFASVAKANGVTHMVAICAICKSQFSQVFPHYGFSMDKIISLHHLVGRALVMTKSPSGQGPRHDLSGVVGVVGGGNKNGGQEQQRTFLPS